MHVLLWNEGNAPAKTKSEEKTTIKIKYRRNIAMFTYQLRHKN